MANEITRNGGSRELSRELSDEMVARLVKGFSASIASSPSGYLGKPLLRLLKTGSWVFGQNDDAVQDGSEWAINPLSVQHGWSCWSNYPGNDKNRMLGEQMVPAFDPKPAQPASIDGFPFEEQRVFEAACLTGTDEGTEVLYKVGSKGGVEACNILMSAVTRRAEAGESQWLVPIVQFDTTSYQHPKWGLTFKPVFTVTGWGNLRGERQEQPEAEDQAEQPQAAKPQNAKPPLPARPGAAPRRQRPEGRA